MEITVSIMYRDAKAIYRVREDSRGIFLACLQHYEGSTHSIPPPNLVITKGVRHWVGSFDDEVLINDIGETIEVHLQSGISFNAGRFDEDRQSDGTTGEAVA